MILYYILYQSTLISETWDKIVDLHRKTQQPGTWTFHPHTCQVEDWFEERLKPLFHHEIMHGVHRYTFARCSSPGNL